MKQRLDLTIDAHIADEFRKLFCKKKGDLSNHIEILMILKIHEYELLLKYPQWKRISDDKKHD